MPNFRTDKKDYNYTKYRFPIKNKKSFINFKRHNEWNDSIESDKPKWIKISCKTDTPNCMPDLVHELEEVVLKYSDKKTNFQAINPIFSDGRLDFYLKVVKTESKVLYRNYSTIKRYDIKCMEFDDINMPHVFPEDWTNFMMQALDKRFSKSEATGDTEIDLSNFSNDAFLAQHGLLLRMSNAHVMKNVLNMLKKTNLTTITRLNLSSNEISNIYQLELFLDHCSVLRIDLSNNRLSRMSDLKFMAKSGVIDLNVSNNDFDKKTNTKQLQEDIRKILPALAVLNGKTLPATIIIAGDSVASKKVLPATILSDKSADVYSAFVVKYCAAFDNVTRDGLCEYYSQDSVLTIACYSSDMPYCYRSHNSNILMKKDYESSSDNYKRGKASIVGSLAGIPKTKHIEETLNVDVAFRTSTDMMFTLSGVYVELPDRGSKTYRPRQFSRTFVINSGIILHEHISVMPTDSHLYNKFKSVIEIIKEQNEFPEKYKEQLKNISPEAVEIVRQFKTSTGMTVPACLEFLSFLNNLSEAMEKFTEMKSQGLIPKEAYEYK